MKSMYLFSFLLFSALATSPNLYGSDAGLPFFTEKRDKVALASSSAT